MIDNRNQKCAQAEDEYGLPELVKNFLTASSSLPVE
jgi:hypothetical protein